MDVDTALSHGYARFKSIEENQYLIGCYWKIIRDASGEKLYSIFLMQWSIPYEGKNLESWGAVAQLYQKGGRRLELSTGFFQDALETIEQVYANAYLKLECVPENQLEG